MLRNNSSQCYCVIVDVNASRWNFRLFSPSSFTSIMPKHTFDRVRFDSSITCISAVIFNQQVATRCGRGVFTSRWQCQGPKRRVLLSEGQQNLGIVAQNSTAVIVCSYRICSGEVAAYGRGGSVHKGDALASSFSIKGVRADSAAFALWWSIFAETKG